MYKKKQSPFNPAPWMQKQNKTKLQCSQRTKACIYVVMSMRNTGNCSDTWCWAVPARRPSQKGQQSDGGWQTGGRTDCSSRPGKCLPEPRWEGWASVGSLLQLHCPQSEFCFKYWRISKAWIKPSRHWSCPEWTLLSIQSILLSIQSNLHYFEGQT